MRATDKFNKVGTESKRTLYSVNKIPNRKQFQRIFHLSAYSETTA
jgi:hypothetical protein